MICEPLAEILPLFRTTMRPENLAALENRQHFYVAGMREHVRDAGGAQPIPLRVDQLLRIPRQRRGVARHISDTAWRHAFHLRDGRASTRARRIQDDEIPGLAHKAPLRLRQIGRDETGIRKAVTARIVRRAGNETALALNTEYRGSMPREWQTKIAKAAVEIQDSIGRLYAQQLDRATYHRLVNVRINLNEVRRRKLQR